MNEGPKLFVQAGQEDGKPIISITVNGRETVNVSVELAESFAQSLDRQIKLAKGTAR